MTQDLSQPVEPEVVDPSADGSIEASSGIEQPGKVMRIATMVRQLLEEIRHSPMDDASRAKNSSPSSCASAPSASRLFRPRAWH